MRYSFLKLSSSQSFIAFAAANWVFMISLMCSVILLLITIALMFSGMSESWEKRCAKLLLFFVVPVFVWSVYFLQPVFSPFKASVLVWAGIGLIIIAVRTKRMAEERNNIAKMQAWRCPKCRHINQKLYLVCARCGFKKAE